MKIIWNPWAQLRATQSLLAASERAQAFDAAAHRDVLTAMEYEREAYEARVKYQQSENRVLHDRLQRLLEDRVKDQQELNALRERVGVAEGEASAAADYWRAVHDGISGDMVLVGRMLAALSDKRMLEITRTVMETGSRTSPVVAGHLIQGFVEAKKGDVDAE